MTPAVKSIQACQSGYLRSNRAQPKPVLKMSSTPAKKRSPVAAILMLFSGTCIVTFRVLRQFAVHQVNAWTWAGVAMAGILAVAMLVKIVQMVLKPKPIQ